MDVLRQSIRMHGYADGSLVLLGTDLSSPTLELRLLVDLVLFPVLQSDV
jgi:hypothetical protein